MGRQTLTQSIILTGFVKTHVLDEHANEIVGEVSSGTSESDDEPSSNRTCKLHRLKNLPAEVVVLTCEIDVKAEETFVWSQQVSCFAVLCISHFCG